MTTTREALERIDDEWQKGYSKLILVGHSLGALIVRKVYAAACGSHPLAPMEPELGAEEPRAWAEAVERLVLLASIDRGWRLSHHVRLSFALLKPITAVFRAIDRWGIHKMPAFECERGQPFVENLRVQWARMLWHHERQGGPGGAMAIQLVGTKDDFVGPLEAVDPLFIATKATGARHNHSGTYISLEVPQSYHDDIICMGPCYGANGKARREMFLNALTWERSELEKIQTLLVEESQMLERDTTVTDVVFVIHGIRDTGYWTQHIAQRVKKHAKEAARKVHFATETSTYGYFAMLPFLLSRTRRNKVEWLLDQYAENVVLYPVAKFHYIGHSNGTYLLAKTLESSRCRQFHNIIFAGSVVHNDYDWEQRKKDLQVQRVANYVATHDWVVAVFPWATGWLQRGMDFGRRFFGWEGKGDLGSAGDTGFSQGGKVVAMGVGGNKVVENIGPVPGAHGAALVEENWDAMAKFIIYGGAADCGVTSRQRNTGLLFLLRLAFLVILGVIGGMLWWFWPWNPSNPLHWAAWEKSVLYVAGILGLYQVVTKV